MPLEGSPIDRLKETLVAMGAKPAGRIPLALLANRKVFGDLLDHERFVAGLHTEALSNLHTRGARAAVESLVSEA